MKINVFNDFSQEFKKSIQDEIERFLSKEIKQIRKENERLQEDNIRLVRIVKRFNKEKKINLDNSMIKFTENELYGIIKSIEKNDTFQNEITISFIKEKIKGNV